LAALFSIANFFTKNFMMKKPAALIVLFLVSQIILAQQKPDSLQTVSWPDTIKRTQFNEGVISDPLQLILGKEPGAEVYKAGSDPNVPSDLIIRGSYGLYSETHPLYLIDGIIGGDLFMVPPQEIESVKILKNLAETSFYGTEGSNGVVLIITKKGKKNRHLSVDFNTAVSMSQTKGLSGLLSADEMRQQALMYPEIEFTDGGASTDWQDELFRTAVSQSYQLALGGTLKNTTYRLSFDHIDQPGNVIGSGMSITGGSVSLSQTAFKKKLRVDGMVSFYQSQSDFIFYPAQINEENLFYQIFIQNPTDPVYTSDGSTYNQSQRVFQYSNPVALVNTITNEGKTKQLSAVLKATWDIWKGFGIKFSGSYTDNKTTTLYDRPAGAYPGAVGYSKNGMDDNSRFNLLAGLTYNKCLGNKHFFDLFAGYIYRSSTRENLVDLYNAHSITVEQTMATLKYNDYSFRTDLNYHFMQKYHIGLVLNQEHDQSNVTPYENGKTLDWGQWIFYPGISVSWEINREKFMKKIKAVSTLILKGSYGMAGTRPKAAYLSDYNPGLTNNKLEIETTAEFTTGLEAGFVRNRMMAEIEYYNRNTNNAITRQHVPVPPSLVPYSYQNGMQVTNSGIELKVMARVIDKKKMTWNSILCFSMNKNEVTSVEENATMNSGYIGYYFHYTDSPYILTTISGHSVLAFNLPVSVGYHDGQPIYEQKDGGFTNNVNQAKRNISDKVFPDYIFSWTNSFTILKSIDVSLLFQYVAGHRIFNGTRMYLSIPSNYLNLNTIPEAENNYNAGVYILPFSDLYLENASYLRLENLSVGYTYVPQNMKWKGKLRVYLAVNNLFTITGYSGLDPAFNYNSPGLDYFNTYPKNHVYTLGINLEI